MEAAYFIKTIENRQGIKVSCPEEIAWKKGWINNQELENLAKDFSKNEYGKYLMKLIKK